MVDLGGHGWSYRYDPLGRLTQAVGPVGHSHLIVGYDATGRVAQIRSPSGSRKFDYFAGTTVVTDANGATNEYEQNQSGVTVSVTNALGVHTRVVLDERNQVRELFRDDVLEARLEYDEAGRLESLARLSREKPGRLSYRYDSEGRLISITEAGPSRRLGTRHIVKLRYAPSGNLVEKSDSEGTHFFSYSPQGDLIEWTPAQGPAARFEHDEDGQIVQVTTDGGAGTAFEYYSDGRLQESRFADGSTHRYQYDELGMRRRTELSSG